MITILSVIWMMFGYALGFLLSDAAKAGVYSWVEPDTMDWLGLVALAALTTCFVIWGDWWVLLGLLIVANRWAVQFGYGLNALIHSWEEEHRNASLR